MNTTNVKFTYGAEKVAELTAEVQRQGNEGIEAGAMHQIATELLDAIKERDLHIGIQQLTINSLQDQLLERGERQE